MVHRIVEGFQWLARLTVVEGTCSSWCSSAFCLSLQRKTEVLKACLHPSFCSLGAVAESLLFLECVSLEVSWIFLCGGVVGDLYSVSLKKVYNTLFSIQDWEVLVLEKLKWDLLSVIANDFLDHILQRLPLPQNKVDLVKKHAQTFIALCATGIICVVIHGLLGEDGAVAGL